MSTRHKWADVITAWSEGEAIQCQRVAADHVPGWTDKWSDDCPRDEYGTPAWNHPHYRWRIKPRMCFLNGYEVPAPERRAPAHKTHCWCPCPTHEDYVSNFLWLDDATDRRLLRRGRVHLSRDAAQAHARAEVLAVGGTLEGES